MRSLAGLAVFLVVVGLVCTNLSREEAEDRVDQAGARAGAEILRQGLQARDSAEHPRGVAVIEDAAEQVPGSPEIRGLQDTTGDGRDDDGRVAVWVGQDKACVSIPADDGAIDVSGGPCD